MSIILLRHTRPDIDDGICYGRTDLALSDNFETELARLVVELPQFERLVSSPLSRCHLLAQALARHHELTVSIDERVQEMDFGDWEGVSWNDIPRDQVRRWERQFMHARPHGGESVAMLFHRTHEALAEYRRSGQRTLIVTHSGVIRAALATGETAADFNAAVEFGQFVELTGSV